MDPKVHLRAIALFCLVIGLVTAGVGAKGVVLGRRSAHWPRADGRIVQSRVVARAVKHGVVHDPLIRYTFAVGPKTYSGARVHYGSNTGDLEYALATVHGYAVGRAVSVSYDPEDPTANVLQPGLKPNALIVPGIGAVLLACGAWGLMVCRPGLSSA
jgi:hypothetical protein